jgi:PAS domain S-box-containing protein
LSDSPFHTQIIEEAARSAKSQAETIANAAQAAQAHTEIIADALTVSEQRFGRLLEAAQAAQAHAEIITEALKISELHYRRLFETARDGILILDSETGKITDANPFMGELLGYSHDEFLGREIWEIGLLRDKETSQEAFEQLQQDGYIRYENLPLRTQTGERREVEFVSNLYRENGQSVIQCNIRDITERKAAAKKINISELHYRRLFETARDGILILDSETGKITDANPFMVELLGYSHDELLGKELWEIGLIQDKKANQEAFRQLQEDGNIRYDDLPLETRLGERREVKFISSLYRENENTVIQCNIRDITERKALERSLAAVAYRNERIAETLQRSMLQEAPEGKFPGLRVKTLYQAALDEAQVGGDFFDAFALGQGKVALVVGDVSGKGLLAAGRTAEVKYALRAILHADQVPDIALAHLNDFICETHRLDKDNVETFIVLVLAVVDTTTGETVLSSAGAEPTLILRAGGLAEPMEITGLPLGVEGSAVYTAKTTRLEVGDTLLMVTDGITESRRGHAFLGSEGLAALVEKAGPTASLLDLQQAVYGGAWNFADGVLHDDICLLIARRQ